MRRVDRRRAIVAILILAVAVGFGLYVALHVEPERQRALSVAASAAAEASPPADAMLRGSVTAPVCGGGYALVGAAVMVQDEHGTVIGAGTTGRADTAADGTHAVCTVHFAVPLAHKAAFYQIHIGTHGAPTYSYDQLAALGFTLVLTLD